MSQAEHFDGNEPQEKQYTRWHNPTESVVTIKPWVGQHIQTAQSRSGREKYVWQPGETKRVPAEYDLAIKHDDGSGLAPQLVKLEPGEEAPRKAKPKDVDPKAAQQPAQAQASAQK